MIICAFVFALPALAQGLPDQIPSASIEGVVFKLGTNEPIAGAYVELSKAELFSALPSTTQPPPIDAKAPPSIFRTTTTNDGRFVLRELPAGRYRLVATRSGTSYVPAEYGQRDPKGRGTSFVLAAGQKMTNVQLGLAVTGSISGRIMDSDGEGIGNARVMALDERYQNGRRVLNIAQAVRTNDLGEYRLFWLRPGRYYVAVKREDQRNFSFSVHITSPEVFGLREDASSPIITERKLDDGRLIEETDIVMYYGGGADPQKALPIDLHSGASVSAIDIPVGEAKVEARRINGVVVGTDGQPVANALVRLIPRKSAAHAIWPNAKTDKQGKFDIGGIVPGTYWLSATADLSGTRGFSFNESFIEIGPGVGGLMTIEIGNRDLQNVSLLAKPAFTMPGRLYVEGGSGKGSSFNLVTPRISLVRDPDLLGLPATQSRNSRSGPQSGVPGSDGVFTLSGFGQGSYRVLVSAMPPDAYVKAIRAGAADVLNSGLQVDNAPDAQLDILINLDGGSLEGIVMNEKSERVVNALVALVPDAPFRGSLHLYKSDATDTSGHYAIKGIAPGDYKVFAFEFVETGAWQNVEFLQTVEERGTPIRFNDATPQSLQLTVVPRGR